MPRFAPLGLTWQAAWALEVYAQTRSLPGMAIREHTQLGVILEVWSGRVLLRQAFRRPSCLYLGLASVAVFMGIEGMPSLCHAIRERLQLDDACFRHSVWMPIGGQSQHTTCYGGID